jgi:hypothetical protein
MEQTQTTNGDIWGNLARYAGDLLGGVLSGLNNETTTSRNQPQPGRVPPSMSTAGASNSNNQMMMFGGLLLLAYLVMK